MEWYIALSLLFVGLIFLLVIGIPVAISFMFIVVFGAYIYLGGTAGLEQIVINIFGNLATFAILPLPLFIFMGDLLFDSELAPILLDVLDKWLGRIPGRLSFLAVAGGVLLSVMSGASVASVAILGDTLLPEIRKRGYGKAMAVGPIMASGGLAVLIPPSGLAIFVAAIGQFSVGGLLIATIIPGLVIALLYSIYIIVRCFLQPQIAPPYDVPSVPMKERILLSIRHLVPVAFIIFMVTGVIFLGVATPSEAAATGVFGILIVLATYKRLNWNVLSKAMGSTIKTTGMLFLIIASAKAFSSILSFTGGLTELTQIVSNLHVAPILIIIVMQIPVLIMGCFMDPGSITMITLPVYLPIISALGFNPVWFGAIFLLNLETGFITPPFGLNLFVMQGIAPEDIRIKDIYLSVVPYVVMDLIVISLMIIFPQLALWLPSLMRTG